MKKEDLFRAIGGLETSRLAKTEEEAKMRSGMKFTRRLLIAAIITALLVGTAYAAARFFLFDSPQEMVQGLYGSGDSKAPTEVPDDQKPWPSSYMIPGYDKRPVDETVAQAMENWISPVGQTLENGGYKLTVDAYVYDSALKAGFVTLALEHPEPLDDETLHRQYDGEIIPGMLGFSQHGRAYILDDKTTDTTLALTYYFHCDMRSSSVFAITLDDHNVYQSNLEDAERFAQERRDYIAKRREELRQELTAEEAAARLQEESGFSGHTGEYDDYYYLAANEFDWSHAEEQSTEAVPREEIEARLRQELTPEEAEAKLRALWGDGPVDATFGGRAEVIAEGAYFFLTNAELDARPQPNKLILTFPEDSVLPSKTFGGGDVLVNTLCVHANGEKYIPGGSVDITLNLRDGSDFVVTSDSVDNTLFRKGLWDDTTLDMLNSAVNVDDIVSVTLSHGDWSTTLMPD